MTNPKDIKGVFAAALTPLNPDYSPSLENVPLYLDFLACRGCHGVLLLGTTGEGPSFSFKERISIMQAATRVRETHPEFQLLAGTGTPSLEETASLTRAAFQIGMDGVVVLPPYYYRAAEDEGLFLWYEFLLNRAVPEGASLYGYHIPAVSGVALSLDLLSRLLEAFPNKFAGIKDSSGDPMLARTLGERFGDQLAVFSGNDRLFSLALENDAAGCITALANLVSPQLRALWQASKEDEEMAPTQEKLSNGRGMIDKYPPAPSLLKYLVSELYEFDRWPVRPPLLPLPDRLTEAVLLHTAALEIT
jgi:4-hydroxy-tetrahydrodipicolinate synthase